MLRASRERRSLGLACWTLALGIFAGCATGRTIDAASLDLLSVPAQVPWVYWIGAGLVGCGFLLFRDHAGQWTSLAMGILVAVFMVGPTWMEAAVRSPDSYAQAIGVSLLSAGRQTEFWYYPFIGFHALALVLDDVVGLAIPGGMRLMSLSMFTLVPIVAFPLVASNTSGHRLPLALTGLIGMMGLANSVSYNPQALGLLLFATCVFLLTKRVPGARPAFVASFLALVMTHGLSAAVVGLVAVVYLSWNQVFRNNRAGFVSLTTVLFTFVTFTALIFYSSATLGLRVVDAFLNNVLKSPLAFTSAFFHTTAYSPARTPDVLLTYADIALVLAWFGFGLLSARRSPTRSKVILQALLVLSVPVFVLGTGSFTSEGLVRGFLYDAVFIAVAAALTGPTGRRAMVTVAGVVTLGFALMYGRDGIELPDRPILASAQFMIEAASSDSARTLQPDCYFAPNLVSDPNVAAGV